MNTTLITLINSYITIKQASCLDYFFRKIGNIRKDNNCIIIAYNQRYNQYTTHLHPYTLPENSPDGL